VSSQPPRAARPTTLVRTLTAVGAKTFAGLACRVVVERRHVSWRVGDASRFAVILGSLIVVWVARGSWRRFGQMFDGVAAAYDEVRPSYPDVLVDAAVGRGRLGVGSPVLEVGCGTGKLTELLAVRGLVIDAVDPGPNMIEAARKRLGDAGKVRFHVARFEDVSLPEEAFAAVFSATAFHWVEPEVAWSKAATHLRPGGLLALLAHIAVREGRSAEAQEGFRVVLERHAPEVAEELPPLRDLDTILAGVEERRGNASEVWDWLMGGHHGLAVSDAAELFAKVEMMALASSVDETADQFLAGFRTSSLYFRIDPGRRQAVEEDYQRLVERLGGTLRFSGAAVLMTAQRGNVQP
jgi:SAM-dependent methyltransferase